MTEVLDSSTIIRFLNPEIDTVPYADYVAPYQAAFGGEPWYEVSQCAADANLADRCTSGFSPQPVGSMCIRCCQITEAPAYPRDTLISKFEKLATASPALWYEERVGGKVALAAVAWLDTAENVGKRIYGEDDDVSMRQWVTTTLGKDTPMIWLDDVFTNKAVRQKGNLARFPEMCDGFMKRLKPDTAQWLAFLTINPVMTHMASRHYGNGKSLILPRGRVPDWRDFVVIAQDTEFITGINEKIPKRAV